MSKIFLKATKRIVCYISSFHQRKSSNASLTVQDIDPFLCTHLVYSMARIDETNYDKLLPLDKSDPDFYQSLTDLKKKNTNLKVLLSVGSFRDGTTPFVKLFSNNQKRRDFVRNVVTFLKASSFDGLEINWSLRNIDQFLYSNQTDLVTLIVNKIIQNLSNAFRPHKLILSAMVSGLNDVAAQSYDIPSMIKYLDFVTIMMYDFYEIPLKLKQATHHNPLFSRAPQDNDSVSQPSLDNSVMFWLLSSAPRDKIVLGIELYGRSYRLFKSRANNALGGAVNKEGAPGNFTQINGILSYFEICDLFDRKDEWIFGWLEVEKVPYTYDRQETIAFYEDPSSVEAKAAYVRSNNLGGVGLFSLDMDDFNGLFCNLGPYPLVNTVKDVFA